MLVIVGRLSRPNRQGGSPRRSDASGPGDKPPNLPGPSHREDEHATDQRLDT